MVIFTSTKSDRKSADGTSTQLDVQKYESDILRILKVEEILLGKLKIQVEKLTFPLNHLEARVVPSHKSCKGRPAFSSIFILKKLLSIHDETSSRKSLELEAAWAQLLEENQPVV